MSSTSSFLLQHNKDPAAGSCLDTTEPGEGAHPMRLRAGWRNAGGGIVSFKVKPDYVPTVLLQNPFQRASLLLRPVRGLISLEDEKSPPVKNQQHIRSFSNVTSFDDDLTLGAEATLLLDKERAEPRSPKGILCSYQHLNLDHSLASSALSGSTNKTSSSISEVLERCEVDAETILYNLGFIQEETKDAPWIPARFFSLPSQARGIDYQLFLRSQVKRLEMEDPCLMLASRFKQVQTMAVTADALFCLYSYVSKTPVQKIAPAHLFWDFPHIPDSWNIPSEPEAMSPLQRLRNAISRMCLYTSPREEGLPVASDKQSPMSRLERIVWEVMGKIRQDKLHLDAESVQHNAHTGPPGGPFSQRKMESTSSETTITESASVTSSCFCCEAPSQLGERTEPILPELELWLSRCTDGVSTEWPGHLGSPERYCYGQYSAQEASSPDESSEESEEDWPTRKGSTTGEEDRMDTLTKLV